MYFVCAGFYSAGHKVIYRNLDLTQLFLVLRLRRKKRIDRRESSVQDQYPLTGKPPFLCYGMY